MNNQGAVLILAGGRSRRMGTDKAQLPMADTTLLDWQRGRLGALNLPVWHSGPSGIVDQWPDYRGPLAGLYSALKQHPEAAFWLVVPVDMPALPVTRLRQLAACVQYEALPVAFRDTPLPLAVPATVQLQATLNTWLSQADGPRSIRALMTHFNGRWLDDALNEHERLNVNTADDWQAFLVAAEHAGKSVD